MIILQHSRLSLFFIFLCSLTFVLGWKDKNRNILNKHRINDPNTFEIDYENDTFLMNGKPFRYISGSIHYFRVHEGLWNDRLTKIRAAGFNAIQFVIPWNLHQRFSGNNADFSGQNDVEKFLETAKDLGLFVVLRPGPYICAEHNGGGLPWWLYKLHPDIQMRSSDANFLKHVDTWWDILLPKMKKHLFINGGNILMVQIENEYGSYGCDIEYTSHLRDKAKEHLGKDVLLYTTDGDGAGFLKCGKVPGVYATVDFGSGADAATAFHQQRLYEPNGPLVNSEYYPAWLDYWGLPHNTLSPEASAKSFDDYLSYKNASVSVYMAHGGTSFGFEAGTNSNPGHGQDAIYVEPTSYDYDGLISEAGDLTPKYFTMKSVIAKYLPIPNIEVETTVPKGNYGQVEMNHAIDVFSLKNTPLLNKLNKMEISNYPMTFEQLDQENGFMLYEHVIRNNYRDPSELLVTDRGVRDRAHVFVNQEPRGILSRMDAIWSMPLSKVNPGDVLQILVENQGRIGYGGANIDFKGLVGNVTLSGNILSGWNMYGMPLNDTGLLTKMVRTVAEMKIRDREFAKRVSKTLAVNPNFWNGEIDIACGNTNTANDTFLRLNGWTKGVAFVNGFNLGRYWPSMGPQITLYVPKTILKCNQTNKIILFEQEKPPKECSSSMENFELNQMNTIGGKCFVELVPNHVINGSVPLNVVSNNGQNQLSLNQQRPPHEHP